MEMQEHALVMVAALREAHKKLREAIDVYIEAQAERDDAPEADDLKEEMLDAQIEWLSDHGTTAQGARSILGVTINLLCSQFDLDEELMVDILVPSDLTMDEHEEEDNDDDVDEE